MDKAEEFDVLHWNILFYLDMARRWGPSQCVDEDAIERAKRYLTAIKGRLYEITTEQDLEDSQDENVVSGE